MLSLVLNEVASPPPSPLQHQPAPGATALALRFPTYLLPSFSRPFRRLRHLSSASTTTTSSSTNTGNAVSAHDDIPSLSSSPSDSLLSSSTEDPPASSPPSSHVTAGDGLRRHNSTEQPGDSRLAKIQPDTIRCSTCGADFAFYSQIVSKGFTGRHGRAYLISPADRPRQKGSAGLMNIKVGKPEARILVTGAHTVSDVQCVICRARVGWKYVDAKEESQKYKIGKFILETQRTVDYRNWEDVTANEVSELELDQMGGYDNCEKEPIVFDSEDEDECEDLFAGVWNARTAAKRRERKAGRKN
ncbi:yippee-domain-containing protein [Xylaria intraflava]|nr:yippee-domain-containing protein [Xylaria intraflava]